MDKDNKEMKVAAAVILLLGVALIVAIGYGLWEHGTVKRLREQIARSETISVTEVSTDTIPDTIPKIAAERQVGTIRVPVPVYGKQNTSCKEVESQEVAVMTPTEIDTIELPRTQRTYKDSTYTAWVSGYDPRLDSIEVYRKTIKETVTISVPPVEAKRRRTFWQRFNIGVQGGYGIGLDDKKGHPYIGMGVGFSF